MHRRRKERETPSISENREKMMTFSRFSLMLRVSRFLPIVFLLFVPIVCVAQNRDGNGNGLRLSSFEEIKSEFDSVPCNNDERLQAVRALFEKMGADPAEIKVEKIKKVDNLIVRLPGSSTEQTAEKIVIGAHYDKTEKGCGAIDNWTGIVAMAHLYRALKELKPNKTVIFLAFGQEEKGLIGSTEMVSAIKKEKLPEYCAMINIDSIGMGAPQVADNMSTRKMIDFAAKLAKEMNIPFAHARLAGGDSDSSAFVKKRIPALTIHALTSSWPSVLHSSKDQAEKVNFESVYLGYRLALALSHRIDQADCGAFREK
jgi:hypothetical protein